MSGGIVPRADGYREITGEDFEQRLPNVVIVVTVEVSLTEQDGTVQQTVDAWFERETDAINRVFDDDQWYVSEVLAKGGN